MRKPVEIKEFESITYNKDYEGVEGIKVISKEDFDDLCLFAKKNIGNDSDAFDFMRISYKRGIGEVITFNNYVGLIQTKRGFQVQVLPKIEYATDEEDSNVLTKKIFLNMLTTMKDFPGKTYSEASLNIGKMNLYELFIAMYIREVQKLIKRGIKSSYVTMEENLNCLKGKILFSENIKRNLAHNERFYVRYEDYNLHTPENKLIKATLEKLLRLTTSTKNAKDIMQLLLPFEMIESSKNYDSDFAKVVIDRNNEDYRLLILWARVFLYNKSFTTFSGDINSRAILFPMGVVYESYVAKEIKKTFTPYGWDVFVQDHRYHLFTESNNNRFALRPDIVIKKQDKTIVLDTKWKRLVNNRVKNYGILQADMYQMYAYSKFYKADDIWLLYPLNNDMRDHGDIMYLSNDETDFDTRVNIAFIDLSNGNMDEEFRRLYYKIVKNRNG